LADITTGGQTGGGVVPVGVGVKVGVRLPVGVAVKVGVKVCVEVGSVPVTVGVGVAVEVSVGGVPVAVRLAVGVRVGVLVPLEGIARLRKTMMVCEATAPSTIDTVAFPPLRFLLINRFAGIV
jgi:hypothetical protein